MHSKNIKKEELQQYNFKDFALKVLSNDDVKFILDSFGYYAQLIKMNAYNAIKLFDKGMKQSLQFYHLDPGFNIIIEKLQEKILKMGGKIILNRGVNSIEYNNSKEVFTVITDNIKDKTYKIYKTNYQDYQDKIDLYKNIEIENEINSLTYYIKFNK